MSKFSLQLVLTLVLCTLVSFSAFAQNNNTNITTIIVSPQSAPYTLVSIAGKDGMPAGILNPGASTLGICFNQPCYYSVSGVFLKGKLITSCNIPSSFSTPTTLTIEVSTDGSCTFTAQSRATGLV